MLQCSRPLFRHELSLCHSKAAVGGNEAKFLLIPATGLQTVPENNVPGSNNTRKRNSAATYMSAARTNDSLFWSPFAPESVQNVPLSRRLFLKKSRACCRGRYIQQIQQISARSLHQSTEKLLDQNSYLSNLAVSQDIEAAQNDCSMKNPFVKTLRLGIVLRVVHQKLKSAASS